MTVEEDCVMVKMLKQAECPVCTQYRTHKLNNRLCCTALKYL